MTTRNAVYATYEAAKIRAAQKGAFARAVRAARILADVYYGRPILGLYRTVEWGRFDAMMRACVRHAAKAQGMTARDLWATLPEDFWERVEDTARVEAFC